MDRVAFDADDLRPPGAPLPLTARWRGQHRRGDYEHNVRLLSMAERAAAYRSMMRSSPVVGGGVRLITGMLTASTARVDRADHQSEEVAEAIEWWLGLGADTDDTPPMGMRWDGYVAEAASALWYGHVALAIGLRFDEDAGLWAPYLVRRQQRSYWEYHLGDDARLTGLELRGDVGGTVAQLRMPRHDDAGRLRFMWLVHEGGDHPDAGEGGLDGVSLLRPVWAEHRDATNGRQLRQAAALRYALGAWTAKFNTQAFLQARFGQALSTVPDAERWAAVEAERAAVTASLLTMDADRAPFALTSEWVEDLSLLGGGKAFDAGPLTEFIDSCDRSAGEALLTGFIQQGRAKSGGAYSMVETQERQLSRALDGTLLWMAAELRAQPVDLFMQLNFPSVPAAETPTLMVDVLTPPAWMADPDTFIGAAWRDGRLSWGEGDERAYRARIGWRAADEGDVLDAADRNALRSGGAMRSAGGVARERSRLVPTQSEGTQR